VGHNAFGPPITELYVRQFSGKLVNLMPPDVSFSAGAPLAELTTLPISPSCTSGGLLLGGRRKGEGKGREGKVKGREGERRWREGFDASKNWGVAPPIVTV